MKTLALERALPAIEPVPAPAAPAEPGTAPRLIELDLAAEGLGLPPIDGPPISPEGVPAVMDLAVHLHEEGHFREAEPIFRRILHTQPDHVVALHHLGVLYFQTGDAARAITVLRRAIELDPAAAEMHRNLGEAYRSVRELDAAEAHLVRSLDIDPSDPDALCNLGHLRAQQGRMSEAVDAYRRALTFHPNDSALLTFLGAAFCHQRMIEPAAKCFHEAVELRPDNVTAAHLLAAMRHDEVTEVPREYIVDLFDTYADSFDEHLTETLRYDAPAALRDAVLQVVDLPPSDWSIIDLGCGTGLCGVTLRPFARELVGVDLSSRMVKIARRRNIYDALMVDDLTTALEPRAGDVDLVVAGDVLLYVGALESVFALTATALRPGGHFAFTTERCAGDTFQIQTSGRFAHSTAYVRRLAEHHGFHVCTANAITVRVERNLPIDGQLFVLRRDEADDA